MGWPSDRYMALEIRLLSFSTGQPHPLVEQPIVFIATKSLFLGHCSAVIEIVGDFLALLVTFPEAQYEGEDMFFLVRWKKGEAHLMSLPTLRDTPWASESEAPSFFAFLSQDILVFANPIQNMLQVAKIVIDNGNTPSLVPLCVFNLPPLARRASTDHIECRGEPNPTGPGHSAIPAPDRPFHDKAEDAIIMFTLFALDSHIGRCQFAFIVHRSALLAHIPAAYRECAPFCSPPELTPATALVQVPWSAWGPAATRWFEGHLLALNWITTTAGQRSVTFKGGNTTPIIVRDFNPYSVRASRVLATASGKSLQGSWSTQLPNGNSVSLKIEDTVIAAGSMFKEDVRSSLPYVEIVTETEYEYDGVLIDEERILGLKVCLGCFNMSLTSEFGEFGCTELSFFTV